MFALRCNLQCANNDKANVDVTSGRQCQVSRAVDNVTVMRTIGGRAPVPKREKTYKYVLLMTMFTVNSDAQ